MDIQYTKWAGQQTVFSNKASGFVTFQVTIFTRICSVLLYRYFFPTFENDSLLCALTDADGTKPHEDAPCAVTEVTAEDLPDIVSTLELQ